MNDEKRDDSQDVDDSNTTIKDYIKGNDVVRRRSVNFFGLSISEKVFLLRYWIVAIGGLGPLGYSAMNDLHHDWTFQVHPCPDCPCLQHEETGHVINLESFGLK